MLSVFASMWGKFASLIMSLSMMFGTTFGLFVPATTTAPGDYLDSNIKNVIYLIGDGMGYNHLEKTKLERNFELTLDTFAIQGSSRTNKISGCGEVWYRA